MSRLTRYDEKQKQYTRLASRLAVDNKLGKLEDLEEQLGCPLEVVFKALKEGIIIDRELPKYKVIIGFEENELCLYIEQKFPKWKYKLKDYKKTWWLREDKSE